MRILMISADRGLLEPGSSGDVVARHQKYADAAGQLDIIVFADSSYKLVKLADNLRVFPTGSTKFTHWKKAAEVAEELAKENNYDLIHTQDIAAPVGQKIKKKLAIPFTVSVHSMFFSTQWLGLNPAKWYLLWRLKRAMAAADGFRVNTQTIADKIGEWFPGAPVLVQPTPADISGFFVQEKPQSNQITILYVGRLSPEKNASLLIQAFAKLKSSILDTEYRLLIVGDGKEKENLQHLTYNLQLGDKVAFAGSKSYDELPAIYKNADIFVLPSNTESFGKVLLEAGAAKCAIVATQTAGAQTILTHEKDALLVPVGDKQALASAIERLMGNKDLRQRLGTNAQQTARQYSGQEGIQKTAEFWQQVAKR